MAFDPIQECKLTEVVSVVKTADKLITGLTLFDRDGNRIAEVPENGIINVQVKTFGFEAGEKVAVDVSLSDEVKITLEGTVDANNTATIKNVDLNEYLK
jgi:phage gp45-like